MTGKEALIILSKCCSALALEEGKWKIDKRDNEALQNLKEIVQKYDKYKRAFEILKPIINMNNNIEEGGKEYWLSDIWGLRKLTREEYELLEELINNANNNN